MDLCGVQSGDAVKAGLGNPGLCAVAGLAGTINARPAWIVFVASATGSDRKLNAWQDASHWLLSEPKFFGRDRERFMAPSKGVTGANG